MSEQSDPMPYMPFYVRDWLSGRATTIMTPEQKGAFADLLAHAWSSVPACTLPDDDTALAKLSGLGATRWRKVGPFIRRQFLPAGEGLIRNQKQYAVYLEQMAYREKRKIAAKKGAEARWGANADGIRSHNDSSADTHADSCPADADAVALAENGQEQKRQPPPREREEANAAIKGDPPAWPLDVDMRHWPARYRASVHQAAATLGASWPSYRAEINAMLEGLHGPVESVADIATGLHDLVGSGKLSHRSLRQFRRYVEGVRAEPFRSTEEQLAAAAETTPRRAPRNAEERTMANIEAVLGSNLTGDA